MIRPVKPSDSREICRIYNYYILNTRITFEETALTESEICDRIKSIARNYPWLVYEENGKLFGYTYANKWKERSAYRYSVETGIYLDESCLRKGIGTKLTDELLKELRKISIHSVICGIALPNAGSIALCEKFGPSFPRSGAVTIITIFRAGQAATIYFINSAFYL